METRQIRIIDSRTQSQKTIESTATNLGELKNELSLAGVDFTNCMFYCGEMKAELKDDSAPIPESVVYKGEVKKDLTFMITTAKKKISSGASRKELYSRIKELNLEQKCKDIFKVNYTQCSNDNLSNLIKEAENLAKEPCKDSEEEVSHCENFVKDTNITPNCDSNIKEAFITLLDSLYTSDVIEESTYNTCKTYLFGKNADVKECMSQQEINDMFNFI